MLTRNYTLYKNRQKFEQIYPENKIKNTKNIAFTSLCQTEKSKKPIQESIKRFVFSPLISFGNTDNISELPITNLRILPKNSLRGESLSSPKNRVFLSKIKNRNIENIIDLRKQYTSDVFPKLCEKNNLNYYNIPIDSFSVTDEEIISNLPKLFELIDKGNFYIACAQGLHRNDIALSLNYVFNPNCTEPPILYGHEREYGLKIDDISRRLHSVKAKLTSEDLKRFGYSESDNFEQIFKCKKAKLYDFNREYLEIKKK